jgi:hypothetical protein
LNSGNGLVRLWVEFDLRAALGLPPEQQAYGLTLTSIPPWYEGCGVSGYDEADCLRLIREEFFPGRPLPPIVRSVVGVDVSALPDLVRAKVGVPVYRGVWFPPLNRRPPV